MVVFSFLWIEALDWGWSEENETREASGRLRVKNNDISIQVWIMYLDRLVLVRKETWCL